MRIQDNGKGFDPALMEKSKRRMAGGISNMKKRAMLIDAEFDIDSKPGGGTKITITTPV
jgi:signal transduction histidine kinase